MVRLLSFVIPARLATITSGETSSVMCKLCRWRSTRSVLDDRIEGNVRGEMPLRSSSRKPEVDPPRNPWGRYQGQGFEVSNDFTRRFVSAGNGFIIISTTFSTCDCVRLSVTLHTRSEYSNAARRLSSSVGFRLRQPLTLIAMGILGQKSKIPLTGVLRVQNSCKSRRRGDVKMSCLHFWHMCTSLHHQL